MKAMKIDEIVTQNMPAPASNRGYHAWSYILMSGGGKSIVDTRKIREDAAGIDVVSSESATGDWLLRMGNNGGIPVIKGDHHVLVGLKELPVFISV